MSKICSNTGLHSASPVLSSSFPWSSMSYSSSSVVGSFSSSLWYSRCLFRVVLLSQYLWHFEQISRFNFYIDGQGSSKGTMVCFDELLGTKLWIRRSFWIWCHNFRINHSYTACHMHVNSREWNEMLWKYLNLVGLQFFPVIRISSFDDLNRTLWLLHVLLSPRCIYSPKNIHFFKWQRFCIYSVIMSYCLWPHFSRNSCCLQEVLLQLTVSSFSTWVQMISKGIVKK